MAVSRAAAIVFSQLRAFCSEKAVVTEPELSMQLADLMVDSIDLIELVAIIERDLDCQISDNDLERVVPDLTVGDLVHIFEGAQGG